MSDYEFNVERVFSSPLSVHSITRVITESPLKGHLKEDVNWSD